VGSGAIDAYPVTPEEADGFRRVAGRLARAQRRRPRPWPDADWLAMALSGLPPVRAGRFFVFGQHDRGLAPPNTVNLRIEAGAAFGTGHHGTTVGCLIELDRLLKARRSPGCSMSAQGPASWPSPRRAPAAGSCAEPTSTGPRCGSAGENARLNGARRALFPPPAAWPARASAPARPTTLIFANILARPLVALAHPIASALSAGGRVILSGLLRSQERQVRAAYLAQGLTFEHRLYRDAWVTLVMARAARGD